jgi:aldose 1-epimerase
MSVIRLASESLRMRVTPELGASVLSLEWRAEADTDPPRWLPLWRPTPERFTRANQTASYLLAPYSNRLRDGRFVFEGKSHALRNATQHALHGDAHHRVWQVLEAISTRARLRLDAGRLPDFDFPFPFSVEVTYHLDGATLRNDLVLENTGCSRMPAGLGFHPYFVRAPDGGEDDVELSFRTTGVYPGEPPCPMLPTGAPRPLPRAMDFSRRRPLDLALDHCFAGWDGAAEILWRRNRVRAEIRASDRCRHLVVYSPPGLPFFAFEPVTNANDGFNLAARGLCAAGVVVLEPGERLEAGFTLTVSRTP